MTRVASIAERPEKEPTRHPLALYAVGISAVWPLFHSIGDGATVRQRHMDKTEVPK